MAPRGAAGAVAGRADAAERRGQDVGALLSSSPRDAAIILSNLAATLVRAAAPRGGREVWAHAAELLGRARRADPTYGDARTGEARVAQDLAGGGGGGGGGAGAAAAAGGRGAGGVANGPRRGGGRGGGVASSRGRAGGGARRGAGDGAGPAGAARAGGGGGGAAAGGAARARADEIAALLLKEEAGSARGGRSGAGHGGGRR